MTPIHIKLRELRAEKGLTQEALAEIAQVRQGTISAIERNATSRIDLKVLERLADALGCEPGDLVERVPAPRKRKK